jgi:hypothetical protein
MPNEFWLEFRSKKTANSNFCSMLCISFRLKVTLIFGNKLDIKIAVAKKSIKNQFAMHTRVMYPKYSKHWLSTVAHTIDCVCSKILNHGLNHGYYFHFSSFLGEKPF